jgi:uncharacterized membrane protein YkvI
MKINKSLQVAATYIGAVMGAGFASGQEIVQFFIGYHLKGLWGIGLAGLLFGVLGFLALKLIRDYRIESYQALFRILLGPSLGRALEFVVTLFLFAGLVIMLAGSGAIFEEYFNLSPTFGIILTSFAVILALSSKGEGVMWINTVLIPLKFVICISVSIAVLFLGNNLDYSITLAPTIQRPWFISAILYVSFNLTFALVVLSSLGKELSGNIKGGVLGGIGLGVFALAIGSSLLRYYPAVTEYQVPMVFVASQIGKGMGILYLMVLWFAMITAAVGNAFSFVKRATEMLPVSYPLACVVAIAGAIPLAHFKFSALIAVIYPLFGYIGLLLIIPLLYLMLRNLRT